LLQSINEHELQSMLDEQKIVEKEARSGSMQVLRDSQELLNTLKAKIQLLDHIETYLQDWLWGLTYQFLRQGDDEAGEDVIKAEPM